MLSIKPKNRMLFDRHAKASDWKARRQAAMRQFADNPSRLLNALDIQPDGCGRGVVCPYCRSGSGPHGTGMGLDPHNEDPHLKCFACGRYVSPIDLTIHGQHMDEGKSGVALEFIEELYRQEKSEFDHPALTLRSGGGSYGAVVHQAAGLEADDTLMRAYGSAVEFRLHCPEWQERFAKALGLPVWALDRPDIGKSFLPRFNAATGAMEDDGDDSECGDLVTFNLGADGRPVAVKTRFIKGLTYTSHTTWLNPRSNAFEGIYLETVDVERTFRLSGRAGELCFGHNTVTDGITTVAVVEGQSDVLAACAAAREAGRKDVTAIGRDNKGHILKPADLDVLRGRDVVYCNDFDAIGDAGSERNVELLRGCARSVTVWNAPAEMVKDVRAFYICHGGQALTESLFNSHD